MLLGQPVCVYIDGQDLAIQIDSVDVATLA